MKSRRRLYKIAVEVILLRNYEKYVQARDAAWKLLIDCSVTALPVDPASICKHYNYRLISYRRGKDAIAALGLDGLMPRTDGFCIYSGNKCYIFFDDSMSRQRQRFTIAHELGHIQLGHIGDNQHTRINREPSAHDDPIEIQANWFAARILAPACVLHSLHALTPPEISHVCEISIAAATFRAQCMELLEQQHVYLQNPLEQQVARQFESYVRRVLVSRRE